MQSYHITRNRVAHAHTSTVGHAFCLQGNPVITLRIKDAALEHSVESPTQLSRLTGLSYTTCLRLWKGDVGGERSIGIGTLHTVAQHLGVPISALIVETTDEVTRG